MKYLSFCLLILPLWLFGQMVPPISNFTSDSYQAENQNWDVTQATDGRMFFANNSGLLEYNGESWRRYPSSNGSILRSVLAHGQRVYSGCYMDFGYWERDDYGLMQYTSLSDSLEEPLLEDEQFWNIRSVRDWVLFQSLKRIYAYSISKDRFEVIPSEASRARLFTEGEEIYFVKEGALMTLVSGRAERFVDLKPGGWELVGMARMGSRRVFITEDATMLELQGEQLVPINAPFMEQLPSVRIYCAKTLSDGSLALGTISQGLYILSPEGELVLHLNKENGLNNNTVLTLEEDRDGNLWIGLDNGVSVVNRSSAFREYNDTAGLLGEVYAATPYRGQLYVGTNQGLFRAPYPRVDAFEFIDGTEGQVWQLKEIDGTLFCGHNKGTLLIEAAEARLIPGPEGTWDFKRVPQTDSLLLQGHYQGLSLLIRDGGEWKLRNVLQGYDISSRFFEFTGPRQLVVNHEYKGVYTLQFDETWSRITVENQRPPSGIGASLFRFGDQLKYATDDAIFDFDEESGTFLPDSLLTSGLKGKADRPFGILISDLTTGRLWGFGNGSIHYVDPGKIDEQPEFNKIHVPGSFRNSMGVLGFECLSPLGKENYLIGRSNGFVVLDLNESRDFVPTPAISGISKKAFGQKSEPLSLAGIPKMDFGTANIQIDYYVPAYGKFKEVQYQYRLLGFQEGWSSWSNEPGVELSNLPSGSYRFEVRARVGDSVSEQAAVFSFEVLPPWYFTKWAFLAYILILLTSLYGIHILYKAYYKR
ncbi:MAG: triple tyrosine motif-containing protein, partial [Robiginitalea sp.]|nr:triple tyrosine motif-containing protein [Robiginitalea sp.]